MPADTEVVSPMKGFVAPGAPTKEVGAPEAQNAMDISPLIEADPEVKIKTEPEESVMLSEEDKKSENASGEEAEMMEAEITGAETIEAETMETTEAETAEVEAEKVFSYYHHSKIVLLSIAARSLLISASISTSITTRSLASAITAPKNKNREFL